MSIVWQERGRTKSSQKMSDQGAERDKQELTPFSLINRLNDSISFRSPLRYRCSSTESTYIIK